MIVVPLNKYKCAFNLYFVLFCLFILNREMFIVKTFFVCKYIVKWFLNVEQM